MVDELKAGNCVISCPNKNKSKSIPEDIDSVQIICNHGRKCSQGSKIFELVPSQSFSVPYIDTTEVIWTGPNKPNGILVSELGIIKGAGSYKIGFNQIRKSQFRVAGKISDTLRNALYEIIDEIYTLNHFKDYEVSGLPTGNLKVRVYSPERWKLKISFPKLKKFSGGVSLERELNAENYSFKGTYKAQSIDTSNNSPDILKSNQVDTTKVSIDIELKSSQESTSIGGKGNYTSDNLNSTKTGDIISLTRDGSPLRLDIINSISAFLKLLSTIYYIIEIIQDLNSSVPKAGIHYEFDLSVMSGDFSLEWAWMEHAQSDLAYYNVKAAINVKLLEGEMKLAFGLSMKGFKARVYIKGNLNVPIQISFENKAPGEEWLKEFSISGGFKATIIFEVGAEVEIGYILTINPIITAGYEFNGKLNLHPKVDLDIGLSFTGLKAKLNYSVGKGGGYAIKQSTNGSKGMELGNSSKTSEIPEIILIKEYTIGQFKFPQKNEPNNELKDTEFEKILNGMLSGETNRNKAIEFVRERIKEENKWYTSKNINVPIAVIAAKIVDYAKGHPIKRTQKSLEAISLEVRTVLREIEKKGFFRDDKITESEFNEFLNNGALNSILNANKDPIKVFSNELKS
jgi:hypothetical protein